MAAKGVEELLWGEVSREVMGWRGRESSGCGWRRGCELVMVLCGGEGDEEIGGGFVREREWWWWMVVYGMREWEWEWERPRIAFYTGRESHFDNLTNNLGAET